MFIGTHHLQLRKHEVSIKESVRVLKYFIYWELLRDLKKSLKDGWNFTFQENQLQI